MNLQIRANPAPYSEYHIDFARGSITHSQAASRGQKNRIFNDKLLGGLLNYQTYAQNFDFTKKNKIA